MQVYRIYISFLSILTSSIIYAQAFLQPKVLSVEDGLSGHIVNCIAMDKKGYLWIGTNIGLDRYDGYSFKHYLTNSTDVQSETEQSISVIKTDIQGNLWIINDEGLNRLDHKSGEIALYSSGSFDTLFARATELIDLYPDSSGTIWLLTDETLTKLIPGQTAKSLLLPHGKRPSDLQPTCLAGDNHGNIWIGTTTGPIIFNKENLSFNELMFDNTEGILSNRQVTCLFLDKDNVMWVGTKNGLNKFDPVDFDFEQYFPAKSKIPQACNEISSITQNADGNLLLTTGDGIVSFSDNDKKFEPVYISGTASIISLIIDKSGNIWGATSQGILKLRKNILSIKNITASGSRVRLSENNITALHVCNNGDVWIGYHDRGVDIYSNNSKSISHLKNSENSAINAICQAGKDIMAVLADSGLRLYDIRKKSEEDIKRLYPFAKVEYLHNVKLNCMLRDSTENLWIGTSHGLQLLNIDSMKHRLIRILKVGNDSIRFRQIYDIEQDKDNNLWLGTNNGLIFYSPTKKQIYKYTPYDKSLLNTEQKRVYTIVPESSNVFWIGTSRGVYKFNVENRDFYAITEDKSLMNLAVHAIAIDNLRHVWIGTDKGLFYMAEDKLYFFDTEDGFINYSYAAAGKGSKNLIYLGGNRGLTIINADSVSVNTKQFNPTITITEVSLIDYEPAKEIIGTLADTLTLSWKKNSIRIDFAILDLSRPENNHYKYSFERAEKPLTWYQIGAQNFVILNHLSPGKYFFSVNGTGNTSMNWNSTPASLLIIVEAPIWKSKTAVIIYIIVFVLLLLIAFRFWTRQLVNLNKEYKEREKIAKQIMLQKEELTLKNKSITDSINYARRIQTAMLPTHKLFKSIFPESFILYMPKDIVSGDFYWVNKLNNKIFVSAVDCTGHGVPGAFMSIIGFELFRKITAIEGLTRPSDILNRLNEDFHEIFKDVENVVLRDGMDVSFCSIDKNDMILEYSGAFSPLYLIRDDKITEIKGDRFAIGIDETNFKDQTFKNHLIPLQDGDILYIFSDGFADQFGGPEGKKYKYRRFRHLLLNLHQFSMDKQREILENSVVEWRGDQEQIDDILVIGIKIKF